MEGSEEKIVKGVLDGLKRGSQSRVLGENQILYKIIFGLIAIFGIGSTYILFILVKSFNMLEFLFVTMGISSPFIISGFILMAIIHKIDGGNRLFKFVMDGDITLQKKMTQDISLTLSFIFALMWYGLFLITFHRDVFVGLVCK